MRGLPKGLETLIGEGGRTVSVGQARRLCLARVLLTRAEVLLLDEPTTGLDRDAEEAFFETLRAAAAGRTVVLVTHAAIPEGTVDRVLVMRLVDWGEASGTDLVVSRSVRAGGSGRGR